MPLADPTGLRTPFSTRGNFLRLARQAPEVLPVTFVATLGCLGGIYCLARSMTRPDVVWSRKQPDPWNRVSQKTNFKFMGHHKESHPEGIPDLRGKL